MDFYLAQVQQICQVKKKKKDKVVQYALHHMSGRVLL